MIFFTKSKMTVRVPVRKAANVGMRKPSDLSSVQGVKQIFEAKIPGKLTVSNNRGFFEAAQALARRIRKRRLAIPR